MKHLFLLLLIALLFSSCDKNPAFESGPHDLAFEELAVTWDEAIPLGNGMLGALVWEKDGKLRISLDRADLWDLRPMHNLDFSELTYDWVYQQWKNDTYRNVQEKMDVPYDEKAAPTKIPAGAIEFDIKSLGETEYVRLYVNEALCEVKWQNGTVLRVFVDANEEVGWFRFENMKEQLTPLLKQPSYTVDDTQGKTNIASEVNLTTLAYKDGVIKKDENRITYTQEGWGGFEYIIDLRWDSGNNDFQGCWSISSSFPGWDLTETAVEVVDRNAARGIEQALKEHIIWWEKFWSASSISIPDSILEKQWYLELYKFGSAARSNTPPIPLQGVWTADNGRLPPWKGDFHHDLNTQLSYWPSYTSNHVDIEQGFVDWLWKYKPAFEKYTSAYFASSGLNVPGVTTLMGEPMGGWIQYSLGPTVSAWLGQHFYWHWKYTMDEDFLKARAYPWISAVAKHFDDIAVEKEDGTLKLPISSSPEIHDNSKEAWFGETTNFDLSLIRWTYSKAYEMAILLQKNNEAEHWITQLNRWPGFSIDENEGLMFAPGHPYATSHRHFSHLMAWHPLALIDVSNGHDDIRIIENTLANLEEKGTDWWTGYSFSWLANLQARAGMGDKAAESLRIFATSFCLPNSFHVNGDQSGKGYSRYKYRPFTLEGNFAFASGLQEMLIQSHSGKLLIFPAIPSAWESVNFTKLRTQGAFLVSATRSGASTQSVKILSEKGGVLRILNPFEGEFEIDGPEPKRTGTGVMEFETEAGQVITLKAK